MDTLRRIVSWFTPLRLLLLIPAVVLAAGALWWLYRALPSITPQQVRVLLGDLGPWGPLALIAGLAAVLVVPAIPASVLQLGAGLAFGPLPGLLYASIADIIGASLGFWLARRWGAQLLTPRLSPQTQATLNRLSQRMSWRTVMLLRLIPGPAYPLVSFAAGYASLTYGAYLAGSFAGVFPALVLLVFAGDLVTRSPLLATALVVALVASVAIAGRFIQSES